jgi:hypothetical protein
MLVSGMIVGTAFTLLVVPSIYMLIARNRVVESPIEPASIDHEADLEVSTV